MELWEAYPATLNYQPHRGEHWRVVEGLTDYVQRMQSGPLASWPEEVLKEWLYRHADHMEDYAFLGFDRFQFERVTWPTDRIPGAAAFRDERFCASFQNVEERAAENRHDWLAHYMLRHGTWNTPIVLLNSGTLPDDLCGTTIKRPFHLLDGHRRLSFLQGLKRLQIAKPEHVIWVARIGI